MGIFPITSHWLKQQVSIGRSSGYLVLAGGHQEEASGDVIQHCDGSQNLPDWVDLTEPSSRPGNLTLHQLQLAVCKSEPGQSGPEGPARRLRIKISHHLVPLLHLLPASHPVQHLSTTEKSDPESVAD